jgi:hypothetical protein
MNPSSSANGKSFASGKVVVNGKPALNGKPTVSGRPAVNGKAGANGKAAGNGQPAVNGKPEPKIIFQKFFHSVGPRTYASQVKELPNGNHLLVLTEGKRDEKTGEVRKSKVFVFGEDFSTFFRLLHDTATFIRANPLPEEVRERRAKFWARKSKEARS